MGWGDTEEGIPRAQCTQAEFGVIRQKRAKAFLKSESPHEQETDTEGARGKEAVFPLPLGMCSF